MDRKLAIVVIDADVNFRKAVRQQLHDLPEADLVGEADSPNAGLDLINKAQADLVLLDLTAKPAHALELAGKWRSERPNLLVYACSSTKNPDVIVSAMRAGVSEYLGKPLEVEEFRRAVTNAIRHVERTAPTATRPGSVIGVFSKKGGQGVTTIAVNLAAALGSSEGPRTIIADLSLDLGDVASFLDLRPEFTIRDLLDKNGSVDPGKLDACLSRHHSGIYYFGEREVTEDSHAITPEQISELVKHLRESFQHVILDLPHVFDNLTYEAMENADTILLVAAADLTSIRATKYALRVFRSVGYDENKVRIVLNRSAKRNAVSIAQFEETVQHRVSWEIPNDYPRLIESINAGEPIVLSRAKSDVAKSLLQLAAQFRATGNGPGPVAPPEKGFFSRRPFGRQ